MPDLIELCERGLVPTPPARFGMRLLDPGCGWSALLTRPSRWLCSDGRLFVHIFAHRLDEPILLYRWNDTVGRPAAALRRICGWSSSGGHYQRTAEDWLANMDAQQPAIMDVVAQTYG